MANCWYCGALLFKGVVHPLSRKTIQKGNWHRDHVVPRTSAPLNDASNLVDACTDCNFRKGTKSVEEFRQWLSTDRKRREDQRAIEYLRPFLENNANVWILLEKYLKETPPPIVVFWGEKESNHATTTICL